MPNLVYYDRVMDTSVSVGTGNVVVSGTAPLSWRTFGATGMLIGSVFYYTIVDPVSGAWETGEGTYSALNTITRSTVRQSSNNNALVAFAANIKNVFLDSPSQHFNNAALIWASDTAPSNPQDKQLWFHTSLGQTFIYYNDGNTSQWVPTSPGVNQPLPTVVGWRKIGRVVPTANQATVDFTSIPTDINDLLLHFDLTPNANSVGTSLRFYNGSGTLITTADYRYAANLGAHSYAGTPSYVMGSSGVNYMNAILMDYHGTGSYVGNYPNLGGQRGHVHVYNIRETTRIKGCNWQVEHLTDTGSYWYYITGGGTLAVQTAITGLQLQMGAGFAAGGAANLWGSP